MEPLRQDQLKIKVHPRKINLEPRDLLKLSYLVDGEVEEDPLGRHKPGASFTIMHGDINSQKFPKIMFPAPNPVEFYLFSVQKNLKSIQLLEAEVAADFRKVNLLLLEEIQFCIFMVSALEAFINQMIPADFEYKEGEQVWNKVEIEKNWSTKDKLRKIIPSIFDVNIAGDSVVWHQIKTLINLRDDLIHLKTVQSDFRSYQDLYRRLLDHDYNSSSEIIKQVIQKIGTANPKK